MILTKETSVRWNASNKQWYLSKGYEFTKLGDRFVVEVKDLTKSSKNKIEAKCDYCGKYRLIPYREYTLSLNKNEIHKYSCVECGHLKNNELYELKQKKGLLKRGDRGYWKFKENRIKELVDYIEKYKTVDGIENRKYDQTFYSALREYGDNPTDLAVEAGYKREDITKFKDINHYNNIPVLIKDIKGLINKLGRFPKQAEVLRGLNIGNNRLLYHGGIEKIKEVMGYGEEYLIDDSGYKNKSVYEYLVAQYLINYTNIHYDRECSPFINKNISCKRYRSDFTFYLYNNTEIHVEVWGVPKNNNSGSRNIEYNKKRKLKEELYNKYKIELISIDCEELINKSNITIHNYLNKIFKNYVKLIYKEVDIKSYTMPNSVSDEELLFEIMKFSNDKKILPKTQVLFDNKKDCLYRECIKRYGSYDGFAKNFNLKTHFNKNSEHEIFRIFEYMLVEYNSFYKPSEIKKILQKKDVTFKGFIESTKKIFGTYVNAFIEFCFQMVETNRMDILKKDGIIEYLKELVGITTSRAASRRKVSQEDKNRAEKLLNILQV